jgi:NitT/TauT family transport system substrate-binding protein
MPVLTPITLLEPFRALFYAPFYLAEAHGLFAAEGLELRLVTAGGTDLAARKLLDGEADLAWSGPMRPMLMRSQDPGCSLRSFCAVVMKDPFLLVGAAPRPGFALRDLPGLRLGQVSEVPTPVWCLHDDLRRLGLDPATLPGRRGPSMAENAAAVLAGELDLVQCFEPHAAAMEERGGAVWHAQASRGLTAYTAFYATTAQIAAKRPLLLGMVRAMAESLKLMHRLPAEAIAEAIGPRFPDVPPARRMRAIARYQRLGIWPETPRFPREAQQRLGEAMVSAGAMAHIPSYEDCVDDSIVEDALGAPPVV